jgi:hypothetical protein
MTWKSAYEIERERREKAWKSALKIEYVDEFNDYGCHFSGNLVVVRCGEAWKRHPRHGVFNSHSCFDVSDEAKRLVQEKHPGAEILLSIPDLVMRIE